MLVTEVQTEAGKSRHHDVVQTELFRSLRVVFQPRDESLMQRMNLESIIRKIQQIM